MKSLVPLTLRRWADIFLLAAIGAAAFEAVIPLGWYYAALLPDLTSWFSPWFARIVVLLALLVIAFIAVEPIGFRTRHLRAVDALGEVIDVQAVRRLPISYQRLLSHSSIPSLTTSVRIDSA